ncbi:hypothetical protein F5Y10DRAFT_257819 [Nemania abortiva]|nr:hypothetical protein F5Y10DRAFT_257819 [Nemania abortiva]
MAGSQFYYGGSHSSDASWPNYKSYGTVRAGDMPPSYASASADRSPLLSNSTAASRSSNARRNNWCVIITVVALHLVAGFFAIQFLVNHWGSTQTPPTTPPTYNVAIIGGGPAGIAAAQHLRSMPTARDVRFNITIFESKPVLGGVLALHNANGSSVFPKDDPMQDPITAEDITGKALVWSNTLFTQDSERILEDKVNFLELGPEQIAYYRNTAKTVSATRPFGKTPTGTWLQLLWAYGSSIWRGDQLAQDGNLRQAILKVPLKANVEDIFAALGVLKPLKQQAKAMLKERSISDRYATEIIEPQVQRAYGHGLNQVTGLMAMMAAAWEESANAYQGGDLIDRLQRIVREIGVDVRTSTRVTTVRGVKINEKRPAWLIRYEGAQDGDGDGDGSPIELFDKVIMAASDPSILLEFNYQEFLEFTERHHDDDGVGGIPTVPAMQQQDAPPAPVHVTFFTTDARISPWGNDNEDQALFLEASKAAGMRELALVREITNYEDPSAETEYLYRVLSQKPVLGELQKRAKITWSFETRIENAYPLLSPLQSYPPFKLQWLNSLWWTYTIQRAATSVDLNWLAGKIVAQDLIREVTGR